MGWVIIFLMIAVVWFLWPIHRKPQQKWRRRNRKQDLAAGKLPCTRCSVLILPATAEKNDGLCAQCAPKTISPETEQKMSSWNKYRVHSDSETKKFIQELASVGYDFKNECVHIDDEMRTGIAKIALEHYLKNDPDDSDYSASDFYIRVIFNSVVKSVKDGGMTVEQCSSWYTQIERILRNHPGYCSEYTENQMRDWHLSLQSQGIEVLL